MSASTAASTAGLGQASLDDKYAVAAGRVYMTGTQALVRLPMLQQARDARAGLHTGGFISGYRGSPLGGYDLALWQAAPFLAAQDIRFQPGVNEELAATAVWGTQQLDLYPASRRFDGVFGLWYGKGPGVDRCADVFKHANLAGTAAHGGVIAVAGDDHVARSSTSAHQSDHMFKACGMPVFFPSSVQDILDLGIHAFAMSRYAGVWTAMKTIQEVVESGTTVAIDADRVCIVLPEDFTPPPGGLHIRWPDPPLEQEARLMDFKWYAALAYVRANRLNHDVIRGPDDRFGIIASGKSYNDVRQALADLGVDEPACRRLGIRLHKVNVVWPLEATITRRFAEGLQEILVVEEKRQMIEYQLKEELYNWRPDVRPNVLGKFDVPEGDRTGGEWSWATPADNWLLRAKADLTPAIIARAIARRLLRLGVDAGTAARMRERLDVLDATDRRLQSLAGATGSPAANPLTERPPWFCSGCPHNTSTRVPEGSRAMAGIGCHYMALWMDRRTSTFSQMGGEGVAWVGQAPFTTDGHVFVNLGDGTYFHSGILAIRQAIAAGVNVTYKVLVNDAVAMTGGQPVDGSVDVPAMTRQLEAEGARRIVVVTDEPSKYRTTAARLAPRTEVRHRDDLEAIQVELRDVPGCTIIVYDQGCAAEKRRARKRGTLATPPRTVVINTLVCEGCGDCSTQSNCLSVEPVETPLGRKRRINQGSCNRDYSCLRGFCPSFVTVEGGMPRRPPQAMAPALVARREPALPATPAAWGIVVAGIGGTGVITAGQLLAVAAHLEGKGVMSQDAAGLAQKGGATWSHVQIAARQEDIYTTKVDTAKADLVLACDPIVAADPATLALMQPGRTAVILNDHDAPTAGFVHNPDWQFPLGNCRTALRSAAGQDSVAHLDASRIAERALGDPVYGNLLLLGYAWQRGKVPVGRAALLRAIELNRTAVERNKAAFELGRACAEDLPRVMAVLGPALGPTSGPASGTEAASGDDLEMAIARRIAFLTQYQDARWAAAYSVFIGRVRAVEAPLGAGLRLTGAVAHNLFKLMAYKDEYEVARLHLSHSFEEELHGMFEGTFRVTYHLAPPFLARRNAAGELQKRAFGPWVRGVFRLLARLRRLRGTVADPFGWTGERRRERALIGEYQATVEELLRSLDLTRLDRAVEIASLPEDIRGFGHVKARHLHAVETRWQSLMTAWRATAGPGASNPSGKG